MLFVKIHDLSNLQAPAAQWYSTQNKFRNYNLKISLKKRAKGVNFTTDDQAGGMGVNVPQLAEKSDLVSQAEKAAIKGHVEHGIKH